MSDRTGTDPGQRPHACESVAGIVSAVRMLADLTWSTARSIASHQSSSSGNAQDDTEIRDAR